MIKLFQKKQPEKADGKTVPRRLDDGHEAHGLLIRELNNRMKSLGVNEDLRFVPIGYDETNLSTRVMHFRRRINSEKNRRELYLPKEMLEQVSIRQVAQMDGEVYYLAFRDDVSRIVNAKYCISIDQQELGPFVPNKPLTKRK